MHIHSTDKCNTENKQYARPFCSSICRNSTAHWSRAFNTRLPVHYTRTLLYIHVSLYNLNLVWVQCRIWFYFVSYMNEFFFYFCLYMNMAHFPPQFSSWSGLSFHLHCAICFMQKQFLCCPCLLHFLFRSVHCLSVCVCSSVCACAYGIDCDVYFYALICCVCCMWKGSEEEGELQL